MPEPTPGEPGDIDAEMDELADDDYIPVSNQFFFIFLLSHCLHKTEPSSSTAKAPKSRKRKGASLPEPVASKCHARSSQGQPQDQEACYNPGDYHFQVSIHSSSLINSLNRIAVRQMQRCQ
jgi:hypothetical protein